MRAHLHRARCKTGIGAARTRMIPHLVSSTQVAWVDGKPRFFARWVCGDFCRDVVILRSASELGGICPRCISVVAGPCVYRAIAADGSVLYIGSAKDRYLRMKQHAQMSVWWGNAHEITYEDHQTLDQARAAEMAAIRREHPIHNRHGRASAPEKVAS